MNWVDKLFNNPGFTALFSAIAGSIIGSGTAYYYNKRLATKTNNAGYWVNRKDTIFSPIYTQALALKEYLEEIATYPRPFVNIAIIEGRAYSKQVCDFTLWYSVKRDIRYDYVPANIKKDLDNLYAAIEAKDKNEQDIFSDFEKLGGKFFTKNQALFDDSKVRGNNVSSSIGMMLGNVVLPFQPNADTSASVIVNSIKQWLKSDTDADEINEKCEKLITEAKSLKSYNDLVPMLKALQKKCDAAVDDLRKLITKIIKDYEGGVDIKL